MAKRTARRQPKQPVGRYNGTPRMFALTTKEFDLVIASMLLAATESLPVRELISKLVRHQVGVEIIPPEAAKKKGIGHREGDVTVHAEVANS